MGTDRKRRTRNGTKRSGGFALAEGDLAVLKEVHEYRFLRRDHLSLLTGRDPKRLHRRLVKLLQHGYLLAIRLPQQKHIYSMGRAGLRVLVAEGVIAGNLADQRLRVSELKDLFLKHEMLIVDHHVLLTLAARKSHFRLVTWREGRGLFDSVTVLDSGGGKPLPVRPDAFFTIEDTRRDEGNNQFHFFLEIDRSTMPHTAFKEKIRAYWQYREQGLHARKHGIKSFKVLTVTLTLARARNLCEMAATMLPQGARKHFLFTGADNYSLHNPKGIFEEIYLSPRGGGDGIKYPLIPELEGSLKRTAKT